MSIIDSGKPILIDHDKKIINMKDFSQVVVQGDGNSIVISFGIPSSIENINPSEGYEIRVLYKTPESSHTSSSKCSIEDTDLENYYVCSWLIPSNVTRKAGNVSFCLEIYKTERVGVDPDGQGGYLEYVDQITYRWRTQPAILEILKSPFSINEEPVEDVADYINSVEALKETISSLTREIEEIQSINNYQESSISHQRDMIDALRADVEALRSQINS